MSAQAVYHTVQQLLEARLGRALRASSLERITLLVVGMLEAEHAAPARVAAKLHELGLTRAAKPASIERRIRRIENDPQLTAVRCVHPLAAYYLRLGQPQELTLQIDCTTKQDQVVLLTVSVWYRGRALPLAWLVWPANTPLEGAGFWERVAALLEQVAPLLPVGVPVVWLADRAFGTPAFTDLLEAYGWSYVVRVQSHTRTIPQRGREQPISHWVQRPGQRRKFRGQVFKKRGWRTAGVVVWWGRRAPKPLCLVSNLRPRWWLVHRYRRRFGIEALFRQYKRGGFQWEHGQVRALYHLRRLVVGMALASWVAVLCGVAHAQRLLAQPPTGRRRTRPYEAKYSLFRLGVREFKRALRQDRVPPLAPALDQWDAPGWQQQLTQHHARAFVFAAR